MKGYNFRLVPAKTDYETVNRPCKCHRCATYWTEEEIVYGGAIVNGVRYYDACDNCYDPETGEYKERE